MNTEKELIEKIKNHELGNKEEAFSLYNLLCDLLKEKYGPVDKDYDDNPTKRGKEWLDIHHIRETELDDIARRTKDALDLQKLIKNTTNTIVVESDEEILVGTKEWGIAILSFQLSNTLKEKDNYRQLSEKLKQLFPNKGYRISTIRYSLEDLKPFNVKEQLVYANKLEHFLLHYLIDSLRGQKVFSGGPNFLWDNCVALDWYGFDKDYMQKIQAQKGTYYALIASEEITGLYKKLIDWKKWDIKKCSTYWTTFNHMIYLLDNKRISNVVDKEKFFELFNIINCKFNKKTRKKIESHPFKVRTVIFYGSPVKLMKDCYYSLDGKTIVQFSFRQLKFKESFTVPGDIEKIGEKAFNFGSWLKTINIPTTVKEIADKTFVQRCGPNNEYKLLPELTTIKYKGTKQQWNEKFSNVELDGINVICQK